MLMLWTRPECKSTPIRMQQVCGWKYLREVAVNMQTWTKYVVAVAEVEEEEDDDDDDIVYLKDIDIKQTSPATKQAEVHITMQLYRQ